MKEKNMCMNLDKTLGILLLVASVLIVWNWGLQNHVAFIWGIVDVIFIGLPILYLYKCCAGKKKDMLQKKLTDPVFLVLAFIGLVAVYQLAMGRFGEPDLIWDYLDAFAAVVYAFLAGKMLRC